MLIGVSMYEWLENPTLNGVVIRPDVKVIVEDCGLQVERKALFARNALGNSLA